MDNYSALENLLNQPPTPLKYLGYLHGAEVWVKCDYLNHGLVQGNKLRKLKYNLIHALKNNYQSFATFGGAYSNHLFSVASAGKLLGIPTIGLVRGEELADSDKWNTVLQRCAQMGMQLHFLSRTEYREKYQSVKVQNILKNHPACYQIPEGGSNALAIKGASEVITELVTNNLPQNADSDLIIKDKKDYFDIVFAACGTGGTIAGLIDGVYQHKLATKLIGIPVLKGAEFLYNDIESFSEHHQDVNWELNLDYHFGGYGKFSQKLLNFNSKIQKDFDIRLDPVYTGKLFYGVFDYLSKNSLRLINSKNQYINYVDASPVILTTDLAQKSLIKSPKKSAIKKPLRIVIYHSGGLTLFPDYSF